MEKMDKGLSVPKWAENTTKCPKHYLPKPKVWDFDENRLHWAFVVRARYMLILNSKVVH